MRLFDDCSVLNKIMYVLQFNYIRLMAITAAVPINKNDNNSTDNGTVHYYGNTIIV